jgi:hypothetical protein
LGRPPLAAFLTWCAVAAASGQSGGKIPYAPTSESELPDAIQGKAPGPRGESVAYFADDPAARGYLAIPDRPGRHGAIVLIHEWNGLVDRVRQVADALAAEGYVALAADLYSGRIGNSPEQNMALVQETLAQPQRLIANLNAAVEFIYDGVNHGFWLWVDGSLAELGGPALGAWQRLKAYLRRTIGS